MSLAGFTTSVIAPAALDTLVDAGPHSWKQFLFPSRIRLWQAWRFTAGDELSPEVTAGVPGVAEALREEVAACTSRR